MVFEDTVLNDKDKKKIVVLYFYILEYIDKVLFIKVVGFQGIVFIVFFVFKVGEDIDLEVIQLESGEEVEIRYM